jgi:hypothetical protein
MIGTSPFGVISFERMQPWIIAAIYRQSHHPAMAHFCGGGSALPEIGRYIHPPCFKSGWGLVRDSAQAETKYGSTESRHLPPA